VDRRRKLKHFVTRARRPKCTEGGGGIGTLSTVKGRKISATKKRKIKKKKGGHMADVPNRVSSRVQVANATPADRADALKHANQEGGEKGTWVKKKKKNKPRISRTRGSCQELNHGYNKGKKPEGIGPTASGVASSQGGNRLDGAELGTLRTRTFFKPKGKIFKTQSGKEVPSFSWSKSGGRARGGKAAEEVFDTACWNQNGGSVTGSGRTRTTAVKGRIHEKRQGGFKRKRPSNWFLPMNRGGGFLFFGIGKN